MSKPEGDRRSAGAAPSPPPPPDAKKKKEQFDEDTFDWGQLRRELSKDADTGETLSDQQSAGAKFRKKIEENPFVPIGCTLTAICLGTGLMFFAKKRSDMSQTMMRARVLAQGFTLAGLVGGLFYSIRGTGGKDKSPPRT